MPAFSAQEDVHVVFSSILDEAQNRLAICELKQSSFSYDVPGKGCLAEISVSKLAESIQVPTQGLVVLPHIAGLWPV